MLLARLAPGSSRDGEHFQRFSRGDPIAAPAPALGEISHGLRRAVERGSVGLGVMLAWWRQIATGGLLDVLPLTGDAALVAGEVRALCPAPPPSRHRTRPKPERRVSWNVDIQIASTAWIHGHALRTGNQADFLVIADALDRVAPGAPRLQLLDP